MPALAAAARSRTLLAACRGALLQRLLSACEACCCGALLLLLLSAGALKPANVSGSYARRDALHIRVLCRLPGARLNDGRNEMATGGSLVGDGSNGSKARQHDCLARPQRGAQVRPSPLAVLPMCAGMTQQ